LAASGKRTRKKAGLESGQKKTGGRIKGVSYWDGDKKRNWARGRKEIGPDFFGWHIKEPALRKKNDEMERPVKRGTWREGGRLQLL